MRPLPNAFVALAGRSNTSDSTGRFVFDSVAPGTYRLTMQHDLLDSLGLSGIASSIVVANPMAEIRIATPSAATMWSRACAGSPPRDSGFVFGMVRDAASGQLVRRGRIVGTWIDLRGGGTSGVVEKEWRLESETADDGSFVLCGLPFDAGVRLHASRDSVVASTLDFMLSQGKPVRRQDLALPDPRGTARGVVRGVVTSGGQGVSNARASVAGVPEVRSAVNGKFLLRDVPVGTQQLQVQGIGFSPVSRIVNVTANDTVEVAVTVERVVVLDSVTISASVARVRLANQFDERRLRGVGYYRDSSQIGKFASFEGVFGTMPSVTLQRPRGRLAISIGSRCPVATVYIDRALSDAEHLSALRPTDLAALEVYRPGEMPPDLSTVLGLHPMTKPCAVVAWTKRGWR